jgi:hypothetical protein
MNYKTLIAFLGKNQMKDWAKPTSSWELVKPEHKDVWSEDFAKLKGIKIHDKARVNLSLHTDNDRFNVSNPTWTPKYTDYEYFYNEQLDALLVHNIRHHKSVNIPAVLDYLSDLTKEEILALSSEELPPALLK